MGGGEVTRIRIGTTHGSNNNSYATTLDTSVFFPSYLPSSPLSFQFHPGEYEYDRDPSAARTRKRTAPSDDLMLMAIAMVTWRRGD